MAPPALQPILRLNPLAGVIEGAREIIMKGEWPSATNLVPSTVTAVALFLLGCLVFRRQNLKVTDYV